MATLRCTRCDLALPEGTERCPKCLRTSTLVDPKRPRAAMLERDDEADAHAPTRKRWWMPVLILLAQGGLGIGVHLAKSAADTWPPSHGENDVIRWVVVPYFLALTYGTQSVTRDWMTTGAAVFLALIGPILVEGTAIGLTAWLVQSPSGATLTLAALGGLVLSIALAAARAHLTLRAAKTK